MPLAGAAAPVTLVGLGRAARRGGPGRHRHPPAGPAGRAGRLGRGAVDRRHADGRHPDGRDRDGDARRAYAQVGKDLNLPTHGYLGATDAKVIDAQAGLESGMTALVGALAGIDMISGAGMLDFLRAQSAEKLVLDAEAIGMAQRLLRGVATPTETLATGAFGPPGPRPASSSWTRRAGCSGRSRCCRRR